MSTIHLSRLADMHSHPPARPIAFNVIVKPIGALCNLNCRYCYYLEKERLYHGSSFRMSDDILREFTRQYIRSQHGPEVTFIWQGGEPLLLGIDFFEKALLYQKLYRRPDLRIVNVLQTNGTLLDESWVRFFKQHDFLIGVSLDGPQPLHDVYRVDKGNKPTFKRVMDGIALLREHRVSYNILTTVHAANASYPLDVYRFLRDKVGAQYIQFIPIVERVGGRDVSERSVTPETYGDFLITIFDEWVRKDVGKVFVQIFDAALAAWLGLRTGICIFEPVCGQNLAMEHNGDVYACDHFVMPEFKLGNIAENDLAELVSTPSQRSFGMAKLEMLPEYCKECPVRFVCHGGCPKNRFLQTPDGEPGLNYLCSGYRAFFTHIDRPMRVMASLLRHGRPASDIMKL